MAVGTTIIHLLEFGENISDLARPFPALVCFHHLEFQAFFPESVVALGNARGEGFLFER